MPTIGQSVIKCTTALRKTPEDSYESLDADLDVAVPSIPHVSRAVHRWMQEPVVRRADRHYLDTKRSVALASKLKVTRIIRLPQMTSASSLLLKRLLSAIRR
jgi:hypothetical protein